MPAQGEDHDPASDEEGHVNPGFAKQVTLLDKLRLVLMLLRPLPALCCGIHVWALSVQLLKLCLCCFPLSKPQRVMIFLQSSQCPTAFDGRQPQQWQSALAACRTRSTYM